LQVIPLKYATQLQIFFLFFHDEHRHISANQFVSKHAKKIFRKEKKNKLEKVSLAKKVTSAVCQ
jgi:hypothetical protein